MDKLLEARIEAVAWQEELNQRHEGQKLEGITNVVSGNTTIVDEMNPRERKDILIDDWSQTGRGSHIDFGDEEAVPLEQGRFLGRGAMGDVHEITIQGFKLAHKKILFRRKIGEREKKEIEILKRLSHVHMVQLIGTYTQQKFLGIILHPVAVCDLHTFFEDVEEWSNTLAEWKFSVEASLNSLGSSSKARLEALNYGFPTKETPYKASSVYLKIGCLVSAVAYLHDQKIRHKDLKPSNILLSQDRLWLSDFGSATDFTLLSESATDNERGTPRYFAPEMAQWKACGRAADMFSLGCVLLEIITLHRTGTLEHIRQNRSADPSFHANLNNVNTWLNCPNVKLSPRGNLLQRNLRDMLSVDPDHRPTAEELLISLTGNDMKSSYQSKPSIFGICCRGALISHKEHQKQLSAHKQHVRLLQSLLLTSQAEYKKEVSALSDKISALLQRLGDKEAVNKGQSIELEQARTNLQHYQLRLTQLSDAMKRLRRENEAQKQDAKSPEAKLNSKLADFINATDVHAKQRERNEMLDMLDYLVEKQSKIDESSSMYKALPERPYDPHSSPATDHEENIDPIAASDADISATLLRKPSQRWKNIESYAQDSKIGSSKGGARTTSGPAPVTQPTDGAGFITPKMAMERRQRRLEAEEQMRLEIDRRREINERKGQASWPSATAYELWRSDQELRQEQRQYSGGDIKTSKPLDQNFSQGLSSRESSTASAPVFASVVQTWDAQGRRVSISDEEATSEQKGRRRLSSQREHVTDASSLESLDNNDAGEHKVKAWLDDVSAKRPSENPKKPSFTSRLKKAAFGRQKTPEDRDFVIKPKTLLTTELDALGATARGDGKDTTLTTNPDTMMRNSLLGKYPHKK